MVASRAQVDKLGARTCNHRHKHQCPCGAPQRGEVYRFGVLVWSITLVALACRRVQRNDQSDGSRTELRIAISADPPSLDPGLSTDLVSPLIVSNLMDPLVRLDDDLQPEPALAKRWELGGPPDDHLPSAG